MDGLFSFFHVKHLHSVLGVNEQIKDGFLVVWQVLVVDFYDVLKELEVLDLAAVGENKVEESFEVLLRVLSTELPVVAEDFIDQLNLPDVVDQILSENNQILSQDLLVVLVLVNKSYKKLENGLKQRDNGGVFEVEELQVVPQEGYEDILDLEIPHDFLPNHIHRIQRLVSSLEIVVQTFQIRVQLEEELKHLNGVDGVLQDLLVGGVLQVLDPHLALVNVFGEHQNLRLEELVDLDVVVIEQQQHHLGVADELLSLVEQTRDQVQDAEVDVVVVVHANHSDQHWEHFKV